MAQFALIKLDLTNNLFTLESEFDGAAPSVELVSGVEFVIIDTAKAGISNVTSWVEEKNTLLQNNGKFEGTPSQSMNRALGQKKERFGKEAKQIIKDAEK